MAIPLHYIVRLCTLPGRQGSIIEWLSEVETISDYQIVYYHGGTERVYVPDSWRVHASKRIVDAGADLVLGGHPHVLQPMEEYNGAQIVHSLGNFMFGGQEASGKSHYYLSKNIDS